MSSTREDPRADLVGVLHDLARELSAAGDTDVEVGTMFRSPGLRVDGKILAFLGFDGELIVKLPRTRGLELIADGAAGPVTMGTRSIKEWFELSAVGSPPQAYEIWLPLVCEAMEFVRRT